MQVHLPNNVGEKNQAASRIAKCSGAWKNRCERRGSEGKRQKVIYVIWVQVDVGAAFSDFDTPFEVISGVSAKTEQIQSIFLAQ